MAGKRVRSCGDQPYRIAGQSPLQSGVDLFNGIDYFDSNSYLNGLSAHCPLPHSSTVETKFPAIRKTNNRLATLFAPGSEGRLIKFFERSFNGIITATNIISRTEDNRAQV